MKNILVPFLAVALITCCARTSAQSQVTESFPLLANTTIPAMLDKWVDARKSKIGDEVIAQTTEHVKRDGRVVIPKGSKILGHVTEAKARTKDEPNSVLGIAFDRAVLKQGGEIPLRLMIQAIAPDHSSSEPVIASDQATPGGSGEGIGSPNGQGTMGPKSDPNAGAPGRPASPENSAYEQTSGLTSTGKLTPQCHGILGIDGLILGLELKTKTSLIASQTKNVRLDGRTQLMLRVMQ